MKRHKELLPDVLDLAPLRLLGGFLCVDFHLGCRGCRYCLNRRDPLLHRILEAGVQLELPTDPGELADLLAQTPAFTRAQVPLRCGHVTDLQFQEEPTLALTRRLPATYPVVWMTRFPPTPAVAAALRDLPGVLLHVTLTPQFPGLTDQDPVPTLAALATVPPAQLLCMLRPLVHRNQGRALALIRALPPGTHLAFGGLSTDHIPGLPPLPTITPDELTELRQAVGAAGLDLVDHFGCVLRERLHQPYFKFHELSTRPASRCDRCSNRPVCEVTARPTAPGEVEALTAELEALGIVPTGLELRGPILRVHTPTPTARADEVYLSELTGREVHCSTVRREAGPGVRPLEQAVLDRWQRTGFLPVAQLAHLSAAAAVELNRWLLRP